MSKLKDYLVRIDSVMTESLREDVPPAQREAFVLGRQVTPEPFSERNFDWLLEQAKAQAKYIKLEQAVEMAIFTFTDRSVLVLLQTGQLYGVPDGSEPNALKIIDWLHSQGIGENPE